mgnify:CR=1 FL=1
MRIANLRIENFRGVRSGFIQFENHPVLVGDNNSGKTTLIERMMHLRAPMPGEVAFAEELQVSRSAYREAIQVLTAKGLVASRPKAGTRVLPRDRWNLLDPEVLGWAFAGEPDIEFVRSLFELRAIVEPAAARLAAQRRDKADLKAMKDALTAMRRHTLTTEAGRAADRDFHKAILQATRNDALLTLSASIGAAVNWTTQFKQRARALPRPSTRRVSAGSITPSSHRRALA